MEIRRQTDDACASENMPQLSAITLALREIMSNGTEPNGLSTQAKVVSYLVGSVGVPAIAMFMLLWYGTQQMESMNEDHKTTNEFIRTTMAESMRASTNALDESSKAIAANTQIMMRATEILERLEDKLE